MGSEHSRVAEMGKFFLDEARRVPKIVIVLLALLGLWGVFLVNAFGLSRSFALFQDNEFGFGPLFSSISSSLRNGEWPLRMDTILGGIPLYNIPQLSPFYPGYLTFLPIFGGPTNVIHSIHWIVLMHLLICEINMYVFLRVIGVSRLSAIAAAALVTFSANSLTYAGWLNIVAPYSWLPLYLAGLAGILMHQGSKRYPAMALVGIVLLIFASPAQPLIHAFFLSIIFMSAYSLSQLRQDGARRILSALGQVAVVGVLAFLLTSPVILPVVLEFKKMIRWIGPFPPVIGNARIPFDAFQIDQLSISDLWGVLFKFKGHDVGHQFTGILTLALACVAVVSRPRPWIVIALAFTAIYSLLSSTGIHLGLAYLNYFIPMLNKIREPSRFLVLFQFAMGVLAAFGIDSLRKMISQNESSSNASRKLMVLVLIAAIALVSFFFVRERIVSPLSPMVPMAILAVLTFFTWVAKRINIRGCGVIIAAMWCGATLTLLAIEVPWIPPPASYSEYLTSGGVSLDKAIKRVAELDPHREYRVLFDGKINKQQAAMIASYRGVRTFNSYLSPVLQRQFEELYYHGPRTDNYFRILGAKYLICDGCSAESRSGYQYLDRTEEYEIYETKDVLPHSYVVNQLNGEFRNLDEFVSKAAGADLSKKLLYLEPNVAVGFNGSNDAAGSACISQEEIRTPNHARFLVQCKSPGVLVMNEFFSNDWKAKVDGVRTRVLRVNGNQMGVPFAAGSHVIEFRYRPITFLIALGLMCVGVMFFLYLIYRIVTKKSAEMPREQ